MSKKSIALDPIALLQGDNIKFVQSKLDDKS